LLDLAGGGSVEGEAWRSAPIGSGGTNASASACVIGHLVLSLARYAPIARAARRPAPIARITVAPPVTMSRRQTRPAARGLRVVVGDDVAPLVEREARCGLGDDRVGLRAERVDHRVALEFDELAERHRLAAPFSSGSRASSSRPSSRHRAVAVDQDLDRRMQEEELDAFSFACRSPRWRAGASASERGIRSARRRAEPLATRRQSSRCCRHRSRRRSCRS